MSAPYQGPWRRNGIALTVAAVAVCFASAPRADAGDEPPEAVIGTFEKAQAARAAAGKPGTFDFQQKSAPPPAASGGPDEDDDVSRAFADGMDALENRDGVTAQRKFEQVVARDPDGHLAKSARRYLADLYRGNSAEPPAENKKPALSAKAFAEPPSALGAADLARSTSRDGVPAVKPIDQTGFDVAANIEEDFIVQAGDRVFFAAGSADLGQRARIVLAAQARWLATHLEYTAVVEGHADDGAMPDAQSAELSELRARAVRDRLIEEGIPATRLFVSGQGRGSPVADCAGPDCAAQNRRVVTVLKTAAPRSYGQRSRGQSLASDGGPLPTQ